MNQQSFQLGFKSLINLSSLAARSRQLKIKSVVPLRFSLMTAKRHRSSSSSVIEDKKDSEKHKGLKRVAIPNSRGNAAKENDLEIQSVEIQSMKDDPSKIEEMTVQQLRTTLRSVGIPAKGRKSELVSSLKSFVDKHLDGESSKEAEDRICSTPTEYILLQNNVNNVCDENISIASEVSCLKQSNRKVKQSPSKDETVNDAQIVTTKEKLSIKKNKFSVRTSSQTRIKLSSPDNLVIEPHAEPWTILAHKKPQKSWIAYNPRTMRPPPLAEDTKFVKLMSWNVNGLRALLKLEGFSAVELAQRENFDVLCFQETKLQEKDVESIKQCLIEGYENSFWTCSLSKLGYSGTAIVSRVKPLSVSYGLGIADHGSEGRLVTAEFDSFYLLNAYVPNSGDGLKRLSYRVSQWDLSLSNYMKELEKSKPVILTGDLNCAHQEIDIYNPAGNRRNAGFTDEERQSFETNFLSRGFVDSFRKQHPDVVGYTYWGYRHGGRKTNKGWRLDYFLVSESISDQVHDSYIVPDVTGSDHCPIGLVLKV